MPGTRSASRNRAARRTALVVAQLTGLALLAGCSQAPDPDGQREEMIAATVAAVETIVDLNDAVGPAEVLDDGTQPLPCGDGELYQYLVYTVTDDDYSDEPPVQAFNGVFTTAYAGVNAAPKGPEYFMRADEVGLGDFARQVRFTADNGITLTVDASVRPDGLYVLRIAGATACG